MNKTKYLGLGLALSLSIFSSTALAQDTVTKTTVKKEVVQNPDGSWTVIEYPVNKEVTVQLTPTDTLKGALGTARIMRSDTDTMVNLDLSGVPADLSKVYVYAVAPSGAVSLLGPVDVANGVASSSFNTPLNQFMLVLSPTENMSTFDNTSSYAFRSSLPTGYAVLPRGASSSMNNNKQVATTSNDVSSTYEVPMLGVPSFNGKSTEIRVNFNGELQGLKGKAYINSAKGGVTQIKMRFDDMKMAPKEKRYILWAVSSDNKYTKIGQVINNGERAESEIRGETAMSDFGLLVTIEDKDVTTPTSTIYSVIKNGD
jgi:hypothetical protein